MGSEQRSNKNLDHKHSAHFISKDHEAFSCRIVGQKVQRVPALMGDKGGNRCLFVDNLVHRPLTSRGHSQTIKPLRQNMFKKSFQKRGFFIEFSEFGNMMRRKPWFYINEPGGKSYLKRDGHEGHVKPRLMVFER